MKIQSACRPAFAFVCLGAVVAFAFAGPAAAQGRISKKAVADAVCGDTATPGIKAIMDYWGIKGDDDLSPLVRSNNPLPADLAFVESWLELPRIDTRIKATQAAIDGINTMNTAFQTLNEIRNTESYLQKDRGRPALTSGVIQPCNCILGEKQILEGTLLQLNTLKKQIDELNNQSWKQACADYRVSGSSVTDQNVAPGDAKMTRFSAEWPKSNLQWTITDGRIATGEQKLYGGTYTWSAIPQIIGKDGFSVTINASAFAAAGASLDTCIGMYSPEGLIMQQGSNVQKRFEVHLNPQANQSLKGSETVTVKAPPTASRGSEYTLRIGACWGPEVKYSFRVQ